MSGSGDPRTGSGDGGTTGTPSWHPDEKPTSVDETDSMVVSGGGVADTGDADSATAASDRGLG